MGKGANEFLDEHFLTGCKGKATMIITADSVNQWDDFSEGGRSSLIILYPFTNSEVRKTTKLSL